MAKGFGKLVVKPQQKREAEILSKSVLQHFQHLQDPRVERTLRSQLGGDYHHGDLGSALRSRWVGGDRHLR